MTDDWTRKPPRGPTDDDDADLDSDQEQDESFWERTVGKRLEGFIPDTIRRAIAGSLGAIFLSEEKLRQVLGELKLPKELIQYLLQQADHTKREILRLIAKEVRTFLESTNFYEELQRILTSLSFEIRTEIRLIPNDQAVVPEVRNRFRVKKTKDADYPEDEDEDPEKTPDA